MTFHPTRDGTGFRVVDPIERRQLTFHTSTPVDPTPVAPTRLQFPVDEAAVVETDELSVDTVGTTVVRDGHGESIAQFEHLEQVTVDAGPVVVELSTPIKIYLRVEGGVTVRTGLDRTVIELADPGEVVVGGRSHHENPSAEIGIPATPAGVMAGISTFGSALKTLSPERSFPTLRGHPPTFAVGESLSIPTELGPPETGVTIEVPERFGPAFTVAPLAYYLAATVEPGSSPTLHLDGGRSYPLDADGLARTVTRTLKQSLLLDCVVRTEGLYDITLAERQALETPAPGGRDGGAGRAVGSESGPGAAGVVDPADYPDTVDRLPPLSELYHWPLPERLDAYLQLEYDAVADVVPDWHLEAVVQPTPEYADALPYLAQRLAAVRTRTPSGGRTNGTATGPSAPREPSEASTDGGTGGATGDAGDGSGTDDRRGDPDRAIPAGGSGASTDPDREEGFYRGGPSTGTRRDGGGVVPAIDPPRGSSESAGADDRRGRPGTVPDLAGEPLTRSGRRDVFSPSDAIALRQGDATTTTWIGDGFPINAAMTPVTAFENRLAREPTDADLDFVVVCNESEMGAEQRFVESVYGDRVDLSFDVDIRTGLSREELASVFEAGHDFVHYIGHVDVRGFRCADGHLDASVFDGVDLDAFFLNACHSVDQGVELIDQGAIGGIATLDSVLNRDAVEFGQTIARLLNSGFRIGTAVYVARQTLEREHLYNVIGDPTLAITQAESPPAFHVVDRTDGDTFRLQYHTFPEAHGSLGSLVTPYLGHVSQYFVNGSRLATFELGRDQVVEFLSYGSDPALVDGEFTWSDEYADEILSVDEE